MGTGGHLAQIAGVTTTQLQADTEGKSCKFVLSFGNRDEFQLEMGWGGRPQFHLKLFTAQHVHGLVQVRAA